MSSVIKSRRIKEMGVQKDEGTGGTHDNLRERNNLGT